MKYNIQIILFLLIAVGLLFVKSKPKAVYSFGIDNYDYISDGRYAFVGDSNNLMISMKESSSDGSFNETRLYNAKTGDLIFSNDQYTGIMLYNRYIPLKKAFYDLETDEKIGMAEYESGDFYLYMNSDSSIYKSVYISKYKLKKYFAGNKLRYEYDQKKTVDEFGIEDYLPDYIFRIVNAITGDTVYEHSLGDMYTYPVTSMTDSTFTYISTERNYGRREVFQVNFITEKVKYLDYSASYGFGGSRKLIGTDVEQIDLSNLNDYFIASYDDFESIPYHTFSGTSLRYDYFIKDLKAFAEIPGTSLIIAGKRLKYSDLELGVYDTNNLSSLVFKKGMKWLLIFLALVFLTRAALLGKKPSVVPVPGKKPIDEDGSVEELNSDDNLPLDDESDADDKKEISVEALLEGLKELQDDPELIASIAKEIDITSEETDDSNKAPVDDDLNLDTILTTEGEAASSNEEPDAGGDFILKCGNCNQLYRANESLNQAEQYPERAQIVTMIDGGKALVFRCPHCNQLDVSSSTSVKAFQNGHLYSLEKENKTIKDLKVATR